ncbi:hypothetical protein [Burkholderia sp. lig30]|uniref:hypothetical protein n=1 Tax=Burkholderia sp. lig30 TaxID=1192124 RepID=UPI00128F074F|nr:hypothetical protein [Burkholderia sp. lig30]
MSTKQFAVSTADRIPRAVSINGKIGILCFALATTSTMSCTPSAFGTAIPADRRIHARTEIADRHASAPGARLCTNTPAGTASGKNDNPPARVTA